MIRAFVLALALLLAAPAQSALTVVQNKFSQSTTGGATSVTGGITTTSGNLVVVTILFNSTTAVFTSVTDSNSNTWTLAAGPISGGTTACTMRQYYAKNITGGASHTFTLTLDTSAVPRGIHVVEISGASTTAPFDAAGTASDLVSTSHTVSTTAPTAFNNEIVVAAIGSCMSGFITTFPSGTPSGYTLQNQTSNFSTNNRAFSDYTKIVSTTGTQTFAPSTSDLQDTLLIMGTYKDAVQGTAGGMTLRGVGP